MTERPRLNVFEVGPRDGLQNEAETLCLERKIELVRRLIDCGLRDVEIGSFVHPKWVPQMAETDRLAEALGPVRGVRYWGLVPNEKGYERARAAGISHVTVVMSASETHNLKNLNRTRERSLAEIARIVASASADGVPVRAYVSVVFGCPYEGEVPLDRVVALAETLLEEGVEQVSFGDTIGVATPKRLRYVCRDLLRRFGAPRTALHLHDTQGLGPANAFVALEEGVTTLDSSVGGLGGCPYAPGAAGNLGTEDLVHLAEACGVETGVDLERVLETSSWIERDVGIEPASKLYRYRVSRCAPEGDGAR